MLRQGDCVYVGKASAALRKRLERCMRKAGASPVRSPFSAYAVGYEWLSWTDDDTLWYFDSPEPEDRQLTINQVLQGGI